MHRASGSLVRIRRSLLSVVGFVSVVFFVCGASAHMASTKTIDVELGSGAPRLITEVDAVDASSALGFGASGDVARLLSNPALVRAWLIGGISLTSDAGACSTSESRISSGTRDGRAALRVAVDYRCPSAAHSLSLRDDTLGTDPNRQTIVTVHTGAVATTRFLSGSEHELVLVSSPPALATVRHFIALGAVHLTTGYDHLAFLLSLLLAAGSVAAAAGRRRALADTTKVVTAFTLGHSVTLAAASLGAIALPTRITESAIALSVVVVAVLNILRPTSSVGRPGLAAVFGLIHGFGFSSVLSELGLPAGQRALALVGFNLGIELAQLAFVALLLPLLAFLAVRRGYRAWVVQGGSAIIAVFGCAWLVERALG